MHIEWRVELLSDEYDMRMKIMSPISSTLVIASVLLIGGCASDEGNGLLDLSDASPSSDTLAPFGAACKAPSDCKSSLCSFINGTDGDSYSLDPATSLGGATGMCTVACDFNPDCPPPGSDADANAYWCNDHFGGVTATNPDGRYCVHR